MELNSNGTRKLPRINEHINDVIIINGVETIINDEEYLDYLEGEKINNINTQQFIETMV